MSGCGKILGVEEGLSGGFKSPEPERTPSPRANLYTPQPIIYLLFALLLLAISLASMRLKGPVYDESAHLPAGYSYLAFGDFRLNPEHPPLIKLLAAAPLLFLRPKVDANDASWGGAEQWQFGSKFLYDWNDADRMLFWGRVPVVLLSALLGLAVGWCARDLYGSGAGYMALLLYLFNPDLLAHGQLVTTDLGVTCFLFLAVYTFYRTLRHLTVGHLLIACLTAGLALVSKFTGLLVFPMLWLVGLTFALSPVPVNIPRFRGQPGNDQVSSFTAKLYVVAGLLCATALVGLIIIWACYGFHYGNCADPQITQTVDLEAYRHRLGLVIDLVRGVHAKHLLPDAYLHGLIYVVKFSKRSAFLLGHYSAEGWWYYFLVTFLVKTPLPLLLLILLGVVFMRRYGAGLAGEAMLLLPVGFYWLVAMLNHLNIGHRHLLPIYPFLIVFASKLARAFRTPRPRWVPALCAVLLAWNVLEAALIYPHFLAYFNQIAGGPAGGYRWLVDSNLDWGQDLKGLAAYRREHPDEPFYLYYFGTGRPEYYGIQARQFPESVPGGEDETIPLPSGSTVAVSATYLQLSFSREPGIPGVRKTLERLKDTPPMARIGYSIFVYRIP